MARKNYPTIGCCGIDCGLCPRFYTAGDSRCPGCGGEGFDAVHPPCAVNKCCVDKHGLEICGQCAEYPCRRYEDTEKIERDSFVTHKRIFQNHDRVRTGGIDAFKAEQNLRIAVLQDMLMNADDGRSKGFYCLAAALLPPEWVKSLIAACVKEEDRKKKAKALRAALLECAEAEGVELSLIK